MDALSCLLEARASGIPGPPVRGLLPPGDVAAAYAVQRAWVEADGSPIVGRKIGLTNPAIQAQLGVDRPDFGTLLSWMHRPEGAPIAAADLLQPRIEAEIAFILAADLDSAVLDTAAVAGAVGFVAPALEIVDSRIAGWDIDIVDTVADNASSGLFVLGAARVPLAGLDLPGVPMTMARDGVVVSGGTGAACLGDPLHALAWLAATARDLGAPLRAGEIVLSGALGPMVPLAAGEHYLAVIGGIGTVAAVFR